jgi:hypothetical protein
MKGVHPSTQATKLLELNSTSILFIGEGISILECMHRDYTWNKFLAWKLVYASDMSPADGSFWTATVSGLTEFLIPLNLMMLLPNQRRKGYSHQHQKLVENVRHLTNIPLVELD